MKLNFDWGGGQASEQDGRQEVGEEPEGDQEPVRMDARQEWGKRDQRTSELPPSMKNGGGGGS